MSISPIVQTPARSSYDVVIVGGAMYGSSIAWFLTDNPGFDGSVLVVERDPAYQFCSTAHTNSCIRQQFSQEINVRVSQFGVEYLKNFRSFLGGDDRVPDITLHSFGYMYLSSSEAFSSVLRENQKMQEDCGAGTRLLTNEELREAFPFYYLDDIVLGSHNPVNEGYFDGHTMFDWWKRSARERGVEYLTNEVVDMALDPSGKQVNSVTLKTGETVCCGTVVNASGPRAVSTSRMVGIDIPVEPRKRYTFVFDAETPLSCDLPLTIDPSGVHMRTDGQYYMAGCPPDDDPAVAYDDFIEDHSLWENKVWPAIANRVPQFEAVKLVNSWVGHYAYNTVDQNAIVGPHPDVANFYFANGFSGHGFQQSPAIGRGLAEHIAYGSYRSLDLTPFRFSRFDEGDIFLEKAII